MKKLFVLFFIIALIAIFWSKIIPYFSDLQSTGILLIILKIMIIMSILSLILIFSPNPISIILFDIFVLTSSLMLIMFIYSLFSNALFNLKWVLLIASFMSAGFGIGSMVFRDTIKK